MRLWTPSRTLALALVACGVLVTTGARAEGTRAPGLAFASDNAALRAIEPAYLERLFADYVGPERARSRQWKALSLEAKMNEAHGVVLGRVRKQFKTKEVLSYAREIMDQARVVKMTPIGIAAPMMEGVVLKSPTEKGIVQGKYHHPKSAHTAVMKEIFGVPASAIRRHFRDEHYPRYGYLHFDGLGPQKFLHGFTSDGYDTYGELMWIYKNNSAARAQATITGADSGNNGGMGLPLSRAFVDFQLADLAAVVPRRRRKAARTRQHVVDFFRQLSAPQSMDLGMPEGQAYTGDPRHLEAVAIRDYRLRENSDSIPYGFVEALRHKGIKFYVIKTDPKVHPLYEPTKASMRSRWVEVRTSKQLYTRYMDRRAAREGRFGPQFVQAIKGPRRRQAAARRTRARLQRRR